MGACIDVLSINMVAFPQVFTFHKQKINTTATQKTLEIK